MTTSAPTLSSALDDRYGRAPRQRRRGRWSIAAVVLALVLAATGWAVWSGVGGAGSTLDLQTTGYVVHGDRSLTVGWVVSGDPGSRLVCAIEAQDNSHTVLGIKEVVVPVTGRADRSGTTTVRTIRAADNGLIQSCRHA